MSGRGGERRGAAMAARSGAPHSSGAAGGASREARARRELTAAVVGAAAAGALALIAGGVTWARSTVEREVPLPPIESTLAGADAAPLVPAAGLVLLAASVALPAVRGVGRTAVGVLVAIAGGVLAWSATRALTGGLHAAAAEPAIDASRGDVTVEVAAWPVLCVGLAGVLAVAVGGLAVLRGRAWPGLGRRYDRAETPSAPRTDEDRVQAAWKALDRGEDPTDPEAAPRTGAVQRDAGVPDRPPPGREARGTGSRVAPTRSAGEGTDVRQAGNHGDLHS